LGQPLKLLRTKLKILELHQNKFENPQILKQYPQQYFPACETSKVTRRKLKILEFQNMKIENFQNSHEERHIPRFLTCEKTPKMTRREFKTSKLQNTKTKDLQSFQKKIKYLISPL
jgi:hypothetical protein